MSPAAKVFSIPELLEQILLHLPPKDILLAQHTSTKFRDTTRDSSKLQTLLLFRPATTPPLDRRNRLLVDRPADDDHTTRYHENLRLPGLDDILAPNGRRTNILFKDFDLTRAKNLLATNASCLEMYLQHPETGVGIGVVVHHHVFGPGRRADVWKGCYYAEVIVSATTIRNLLRIAIGLYDMTQALGKVAMGTTED